MIKRAEIKMVERGLIKPKRERVSTPNKPTASERKGTIRRRQGETPPSPPSLILILWCRYVPLLVHLPKVLPTVAKHAVRKKRKMNHVGGLRQFSGARIGVHETLNSGSLEKAALRNGRSSAGGVKVFFLILRFLLPALVPVAIRLLLSSDSDRHFRNASPCVRACVCVSQRNKCLDHEA